VVEEIQKIKIHELATVRLVLSDVVHEVSVDRLAAGYVPSVEIGQRVSKCLGMLGTAIQELSKQGVGIGIEFVVPVVR